MRVLLVAMLVGWMPLAALAEVQSIRGQGSGFAMYKQRVLAGLAPSDRMRRGELHRVMTRLGQLSLRPLFWDVVAVVETTTVAGHPDLVLTDNDNDGAADHFAYQSADDSTDVYGAFFRFAPSDRPAWVVWPVGPVIDDAHAFLFLFDHWVDQNGDGKVDLLIREGLDLDGSGLPERDTSAWVMDDDFDGLIESALQCDGTSCTPMQASDGVFRLKTMIGPNPAKEVKVGTRFEAFYDKVFADLHAATGGK